MHVENTAAAHLCTLLTEEAGVRMAGRKLVPHHVKNQGSGGTSGGWIFGNSMLRREHTGVGSAGGGREYEGTDGTRVRCGQFLHAAQIHPGAVDGFLVFDANEDGWIACAETLGLEGQEVFRREPEDAGAQLTIEGGTVRDGRRGQPDERARAELGADRHWTNVFLEDEAIGWLRHGAFVEEDEAGSDGGVTSEFHFPRRREDAKLGGAFGKRRRKEKDRLGQIQFACDALHGVGIQSACIGKDGERISFERRLREDIDDTISIEA